jgi:hypothetical protein
VLTLSEIAGPLQGRLPTPRPREGTYRGGCSSKEIMKQLPAFFVALVLAGCSAIPFAGEDDTDDFRVPLVCLPKHTHFPAPMGSRKESAIASIYRPIAASSGLTSTVAIGCRIR